MGGKACTFASNLRGIVAPCPHLTLSSAKERQQQTMKRTTFLRTLCLGGLFSTLLFSACRESKKATTEDKHHLEGTEWSDTTGIFTLHFNSPEEVEVSLTHADSPMGTLKYDIPCRFSGDTIYIDDYSKRTPFGKATILRNFRGIVRGTSISANFVTTDAEVAPGATFPTFTDLPLQEVIFNKKK